MGLGFRNPINLKRVEKTKAAGKAPKHGRRARARRLLRAQRVERCGKEATVASTLNSEKVQGLEFGVFGFSAVFWGLGFSFRVVFFERA